MSLLFLGLTIGTIGKVLLGIAVLRVHLGILHEHHIDNVVLRSIKREQMITILALLLIVIGYFLEVIFYGAETDLLNCRGWDCVPLF